jgi:hypothetical protein
MRSLAIFDMFMHTYTKTKETAEIAASAEL